jgi:oligoribonuclease (3'-5' exoribonuclease)
MKYVSIDIETSGLNPDKHQILSIGAIIEDTNNKLSFEDIPKFHCVVLHNEIIGQPYALEMNKDLISLMNKYLCEKTIAGEKKIKDDSNMLFLHPDAVSLALDSFLFDNKCLSSEITVAGKNFAMFDKLFLEKLPKWNTYIEIKKRIIDPAVLFADWQNDEVLPNLTTCKIRAKTGDNVTHNALEDAWDVIELMRTQY